MPVYNPGPWEPEENADQPSVGARRRAILAVRRAEEAVLAAEKNLVTYVGTSGYAPQVAEIAHAWAGIGLAWDTIGRS